MGSRNVGLVKTEECQDCPMLYRDHSEAKDKCCLEFAGPLDDCTRAGIAHKLDEQNTDLGRQLANAKAEVERWKQAEREATQGAANIAGCVDEAYRQNTKLLTWIDDLQKGMYINCVYCGHHYGPDDEVPSTMAEALKEHIETCPEHPMSALKAENERLRQELAEARCALSGMEAAWEPVEELMFPEEATDDLQTG